VSFNPLGSETHAFYFLLGSIVVLAVIVGLVELGRALF
jgi:hypothetical protein